MSEHESNATGEERYELQTVVILLTAVFLCLVDVLLTFRLMESGVKEFNPLMGLFISFGPLHFLMVKYLLTCCGLVILSIHRHRRFLKVFRVYHLLAGIPLVYSVLILWAAVLTFKVS